MKKIIVIALSILSCYSTIAFAELLIHEGLWKGETDQNYEVELFVRDNVELFITIKIVRDSCTDTRTYRYENYNSGGSFSFSSPADYSCSGSFVSSSDKWEGEYSIYNTSCIGWEHGTWEVSRIPHISVSPQSFETLDVISVFDSPASSSNDLDFDGTYLWVVEGHKIHKLDTSGNIITSFDFPDITLKSVAFDASYLWIVGTSGFDNKLFKISKAGELITSYDLNALSPKTVVFGNSHLWIVDSFRKIYKLDTSGNEIGVYQIPDSFPLGEDILFDDTYLWVIGGNPKKLYKMNTLGELISSYDSPGSYLAFDGTYLWCTNSTEKKFYKIDTSGNEVASYDSTESYPSLLAYDGTNLWNVNFSNLYKLFENSAVTDIGQSETRTFLLTNTGSSNLSLEMFSISGTDITDFTVKNNNCSEQSLKTFESCTLDVEFTPASAGLKNANLEILSNDPDTQKMTIKLSGNAQGEILKGDINGDNSLTLADAIIGLQILCDMPVQNLNKSSDVNNDDKIGQEEVIFVLQSLSI